MVEEIQQIYNQEYDYCFEKYYKYITEKFTEDNGYSILYKRDLIGRIITNEFYSLYRIEIASGKYIDDEYIKRLLDDWYESNYKYANNNVGRFLSENLEIIKRDFIAEHIRIPETYALDIFETAKFLSHYKVLELFFKRIYIIDADDSLKDIKLKLLNDKNYIPVKENLLKKFNFEDLTPNVIAENSIIKENTTARQVLAIKYLFEYAGIKENSYDKTELARFIRFLISKEVGNDKIQNTTIYKKVLNPFKDNDFEKKADLKYIRSFFEKLKLFEIVEKINKEIDSGI